MAGQKVYDSWHTCFPDSRSPLWSWRSRLLSSFTSSALCQILLMPLALVSQGREESQGQWHSPPVSEAMSDITHVLHGEDDATKHLHISAHLAVRKICRVNVDAA